MQDDRIQVISPLEIMTSDGLRVETFVGSSGLNGFQHYQSSGGFGNMSFPHYSGSGFNIWYSEYNINEQTKMRARADIPFLELHIPFEKNIASKWDGYYESRNLEKQYDMSFAPFVDTVSAFSANTRYSTFDIHYDKTYLERFDHLPPVARFLEQVEKNQVANLIGEPRFLTTDMIHIIHSTLTHKIDPSLSALYHESNALMMLTLLLDQLMHKKNHTLSAFDKECALFASDIITKDFANTYSIEQLSRIVGTNELKLQHSFRDMFGTTIFAYRQNLQLEHARRLLLDTSNSIQQIAFACGYSENANLTTAFKKKFGCTPDYFRKNR